MKETLNSVLQGSTEDELFECIGLLAVSVAQHRRNNRFVSLGESAKHVHPGLEEGTARDLADQGTRLAEEALEIIRVLAAERLIQPTPLTEVETSAVPAEKRKQLRIHVNAAIKVLWPGDSDPVAARLENISWGGAAIHIDQLKTDKGDTLQIMVPVSQGSAISIEARILRTWDLPDGKGYGLATRFSRLSTRDELKLEKLLKLLAESADNEGQRSHARLTQRLDIEFDGIQELQATLDDISSGGMGITVPEPLQIGQSMQTVISSMDGNTSLKLRARVVRQDPIQLGAVEVYHAGLKFEHNAEDLQERIDELLEKMASGKGAYFS